MAIADLAAALAQYDANLVYEGDSAKAVLFLEAVRWLIGHRPASNGTGSYSASYADLRDQEKRAADYVAQFGTAAVAARATFTRGRMSVP